VKVLEARLVQRELAVAALSAARSELDKVASESDGVRLAFLPAALRGMVEADSQIRQALLDVEDLRRQLLSAKSRQKALTTRARQLHVALERKAGEQEALDTALAMISGS
jgi:hypothetical protein